MKKVVLTFVLIFAIGSLTHADNEIHTSYGYSFDLKQKGCGQIAYELQEDLEDNGVDKETANEIASDAYEACKDAQ